MTQEEYEAHQIRVRRTLKKAIAAFVVLVLMVAVTACFNRHQLRLYQSGTQRRGTDRIF